MKIGILTFYRSTNYGAQLQSYALYTYVKKMGYDVSFVDYWPKYRKDEDQLISISKIKKLPLKNLPLYLWNCISTCVRYSKRLRATSLFCEHYLPSTSYKNHCYDVCIYGSDQIWRSFKRVNIKGFDLTYFGNDKISANRRITYAASMGAVNFADESIESEFCKHMYNFDSISVRESELQNYLEQKKILSFLVSDPVFLLSKKQWSFFCDSSYVPKYKYILYYNLQNIQYATDYVNELAVSRGYKVVELRGKIPPFHYSNRYRLTADAREFVSLINGAEFVVSSSFHGVALSLCLHKQFAYASKIENSNRIISLLNLLNISHRCILSNCQSTFTDIDYDIIEQQIQVFRCKSQQWLNHNLIASNE